MIETEEKNISKTQNQPIETLKENKNPKDVVSLELLAVTKKSQLQHGLKHGDYQRYRQYCTKRIHRIRKNLSFVQSVGTKNRATFQSKPVTAQVAFEGKKLIKDVERFLYIPLICAERSWAYAMQLKQEANTEPRKKFHMIRRFRKAVYWADKLRNLCNNDKSKCDIRTKLETCAYADYLSGLYHFEMDHWQKASNILKSAQNIYEQLFKVVDDESVSEIYQQRIDEIKPTLRYCAFSIGGKSEPIDDLINDPTLVEKFHQLKGQTLQKTGEESSEFVWLGKTLFVKHGRILQFLNQIKDLSSAVADNWELPKFEQLIFDCRDCLQMLRDTNLEKSSVYLYLTYLRLDLIIRRNLVLIRSLQNPSDLLRQYEAIIGCYNEIKTINFSQSSFDDFLLEKFISEIDAKTIVFKAYRCYYISHVAKDNWKESVAMFDRASFYCQEALKNENITSPEIKDELLKLKSKADTSKFSVYVENVSKDEAESREQPSQSSSVDVKNKPLIDRLDIFIEDPEVDINLVKFPPEYRAIPAKPLFFDLALNYIKFPSLDEEINASKQQSGLTGMVKGWLGGWRK